MRCGCLVALCLNSTALDGSRTASTRATTVAPARTEREGSIRMRGYRRARESGAPALATPPVAISRRLTIRCSRRALDA